MKKTLKLWMKFNDAEDIGVNLNANMVHVEHRNFGESYNQDTFCLTSSIPVWGEKLSGCEASSWLIQERKPVEQLASALFLVAIEHSQGEEVVGG